MRGRYKRVYLPLVMRNAVDERSREAVGFFSLYPAARREILPFTCTIPLDLEHPATSTLAVAHVSVAGILSIAEEEEAPDFLAMRTAIAPSEPCQK